MASKRKEMVGYFGFQSFRYYFSPPLYTSFEFNKQNDWIQKKMCSEVRVIFAVFISESAIQLLANHNLIVLATPFHLLFFLLY